MENTVLGLEDTKINNFLRRLKFVLCSLHPTYFPHNVYKLYVCIYLFTNSYSSHVQALFLVGEGVKTTEIYSHTVAETRSPKSRC